MAITVHEAGTPKKTFGQKLAGGLEKGLNTAYEFKKQSDAAKALQRLTGQDLSGLPPEMQQEALKQYAKQNARFENIKKSGLGQFLTGNQSQNLENPQKQFSDEISTPGETDLGKVGVGTSQQEIPEEAIFEAEAMGEHGLAQQLRAHNDKIFNEKKTQRKIFEGDRKYHTDFSKKAEEYAEGQRLSLPKKEQSLQYARDAIESGELGYFSLNKLADVTGSDLFRSAKGAQLITASKENLLSNMSRVTGRAQNMWFEQRLNSMFPKIGQSKEANLTVQEMLEGELDLDKAYLEAFDKLTARDNEDYGYVRKDIAKRAADAIKPLEKDIMQRTTYRMKEIEEQEKGIKELKSMVGKKVPKGTPMTLQNLALWTEKFGDDAIKVAEKHGYSVPTYEEWKRYQRME